MTHEELEKLKQDPVKYEAYRIKHNESCRRWRERHRQLNDDMYKNYIHKIVEYNKSPKRKQKLAEANKKCRQARGSEYMRQYMRNYRKQNKNNIKEKEMIYNRERSSLRSKQLQENKKHCEECNANITNNTLNGLCYECFIKEENKGNVVCKYPKVYWFNDIDIVVTKWSLLKTVKWYNNYYGSDITKKDVKEITNINNQGYWDTHMTDSESLLLSYLYDTKFCYVKQYNNKDTFGDLQCVHGDFYKYISFKEGLLKYYINIKEPEIMCSTEF